MQNAKCKLANANEMQSWQQQKLLTGDGWTAAAAQNEQGMQNKWNEMIDSKLGGMLNEMGWTANAIKEM